MDHIYSKTNFLLSDYAQNLDSAANQDYLTKLRFVKPNNSVIILDDPYIIVDVDWKADMAFWPSVASSDIETYLKKFPGKKSRAQEAFQLVVAGYVKANSKYLYEEAICQKDTYLKHKSQNFNIIFNDGAVPYSYNNIIKNGHVTTDMHVYLLGHEDGKQCIVSAAKNLCKDAVKDPAILQNFHSKNFDNYIKDVLNIPDPELIINFGTINGLLGYLPWHIRLSEIISFPTHHRLEFYQFQEFLFRYSRCEQRFGT